jgi:hypothetical protein
LQTDSSIYEVRFPNVENAGGNTMWVRTETGLINIKEAKEIRSGVPHAGERMAIYADFGTEKVVLAHISEADADRSFSAISEAIQSGATFLDARTLST